MCMCRRSSKGSSGQRAGWPLNLEPPAAKPVHEPRPPQHGKTAAKADAHARRREAFERQAIVAFFCQRSWPAKGRSSWATAVASSGPANRVRLGARLDRLSKGQIRPLLPVPSIPI